MKEKIKEVKARRETGGKDGQRGRWMPHRRKEEARLASQSRNTVLWTWARWTKDGFLPNIVQEDGSR